MELDAGRGAGKRFLEAYICTVTEIAGPRNNELRRFQRYPLLHLALDLCANVFYRASSSLLAPKAKSEAECE